MSEAGAALPSRVAELMGGHFLERAAETVRALLAPSQVIERFIECAWVAPLPCRTVSRAAAQVGTTVRALRRRWAALRFDAELREVIQWGLLGRAVTLRQRSSSWYAVAHELRISERSLERISRRRLGVTPRAALTSGSAWAEERFEVWLEAALAGGPGD